MRVLVRESSAQRLDLRLRPVATPAYWFCGVLFILLGFVVLHLLAKGTTLACERVRGGCELIEYAPVHSRTTMIPLGALQGARVDTWSRGVAAGMTLMLVTVTGEIPLHLVSADGPAKDSLAREITTFAADPSAPGLRIEEDARPAGWLLFAVLAAGGVVCLLALERVRLVMDRGANRVRVERRRWLGGGREEATVDEIEGVQVREFTVRQATSYAVVLRLSGRRELALTRFPMFTAVSATRVEGLVQRFLERSA